MRSCFTESLGLAEENKLGSIAFPAISCGIYGYPKEEAAMIAKGAMDNFDYRSLKKVMICLFDDNTYRIFKGS